MDVANYPDTDVETRGGYFIYLPIEVREAERSFISIIICISTYFNGYIGV